jgi:DNA-directed RNA polymerase specialized sigma24 family protein
MSRWLAALERMARTVAPRLPGARDPEPAVREAIEDAIQHVLLGAWRRATVGPAIEDEGAWLRACLGNYMRSVLRSRKRLERLAEGEEPAGEPADVDEEEGFDVEARRNEVERELGWAAEAAVARRKPRYREDARLAWEEIRRLAFHGEPFGRILQDEMGRSGEGAAGRSADVAAATRARLRIYKRHSRFRAEMQAAIAAGEGDGGLAEHAAARLVRLMQFLHRAGVNGETARCA